MEKNSNNSNNVIISNKPKIQHLNKDQDNPINKPDTDNQNSEILGILTSVLVPMQNTMTTIDTKMSNMDNKMSSLYDEMQQLKTKHEEAIDLAKQAMATSIAAQNRAYKAIEIPK